ncbi:hypothetical protein K502DRAFT_366122 [Neoconidiobolus thromboides FSU 785]|nr:hypothetical protein K502DRAFT_366122 [Neoconidiobolus thromboides FSU 785]
MKFSTTTFTSLICLTSSAAAFSFNHHSLRGISDEIIGGFKGLLHIRDVQPIANDCQFEQKMSQVKNKEDFINTIKYCDNSYYDLLYEGKYSSKELNSEREQLFNKFKVALEKLDPNQKNNEITFEDGPINYVLDLNKRYKECKSPTDYRGLYNEVKDTYDRLRENRYVDQSRLQVEYADIKNKFSSVLN